MDQEGKEWGSKVKELNAQCYVLWSGSAVLLVFFTEEEWMNGLMVRTAWPSVLVKL